jgi:transcriptional regulator with XRE-family HTH domain
MRTEFHVAGKKSITSEVMERQLGTRYCRGVTATAPPIGNLLREWRQRRRLSQLDLACEAEISTRHLSFLETGRAAPSREMVLRLANQLEVPMRDRNVLLAAAGFAPVYFERPLGDPALEAARKATDLVLEAQKPWPAFALDRHWNVIASNGAIPELYVGVAPELLKQPVNALRLTLHPNGLAPRVANAGEWRAHLMERLDRQIRASGDPVLMELQREMESYPAPAFHKTEDAIAVPFRISTELGMLSFFSMTTVFGTPNDVTLSEMALEFFVPADAATVAAVTSR